MRHRIGGTMHGRQIIKDRVAAVRSAFPDFHITIEDQIAEGDKVCEVWVNVDLLTTLRRIGAITMPEWGA